MSGLPKLPDRPKRRVAKTSNALETDSTYPSAPSLAADHAAPQLRMPDIDVLQQRLVAAAPAAARLLEDPSMVQRALQADPNLRGMMAANPMLADALKPEKLQQLVAALQDPRKLLSEPLLPGGDLSQHRMVGAVL